MQCFPLTPNGKVCMDIGASTGGFTDCMLQNGAVKVYAVDVGYGQLAWSLRTDERVVNMERTNIRNVTLDMLAEPVEFFSVDVSFISLHHIFRWRRPSRRRRNGRLPRQASVRGWPREGGQNGVVRDPSTTAKCSTMRWDMPLQTVSSCADWISAPSKALRQH